LSKYDRVADIGRFLALKREKSGIPFVLRGRGRQGIYREADEGVNVPSFLLTREHALHKRNTKAVGKAPTAFSKRKAFKILPRHRPGKVAEGLT
jgi:hypothetical protein